ncbi:MAG: hypothetical protein EOP64_02805 [Sphingomonas sp.]|nr:MAG: hypothetical protein EOP64_02805 [Sphingomonas sp.]
MNNLSPADDLARQRLERSGWDGDTQKQVLNSSYRFGAIGGKSGDNMYGLSSKGFDKAGRQPLLDGRVDLSLHPIALS